MDGRGRFSDNIFVERLWRNLKYEKIYLSAYQNAAEARHSIAAYFDFYNCERLHQGLDCCAPRLVFDEALGSPTWGRKKRDWCKPPAIGTIMRIKLGEVVSRRWLTPILSRRPQRNWRN